MSSTPAWLKQLADLVAAEMRGIDFLSPLACHHYFDEERGEWEIAIFASRTEVVGGDLDGRRKSSRFSIDLMQVFTIFRDITRYDWQALPAGEDDEIGAHISILGSFQGHAVHVRILAQAPERFETGRLAKTYELRFEDAW
ncbi:MAG: hypothetical protein CMJ48_12255 [Planctomycetaceae bacterium]|nr:hypothetical protein [Planctomycetaceae bacterium]